MDEVDGVDDVDVESRAEGRESATTRGAGRAARGRRVAAKPRAPTEGDASCPAGAAEADQGGAEAARRLRGRKRSGVAACGTPWSGGADGPGGRSDRILGDGVPGLPAPASGLDRPDGGAVRAFGGRAAFAGACGGVAARERTRRGRASGRRIVWG